MHRLKSIKLYFFSILKLSFLGFKNYYFRSSLYNKKLITFVPDRIFYNPSSYLTASLITNNNDFYKIINTSPELLWKTNAKDKSNFDIQFPINLIREIDNIFDKNKKYFGFAPGSATKIRIWNLENFLYIANYFEKLNYIPTFFS